MAKQGSFVVQNRRSKRERALQAKEAAGVENSNIGSIIDAANTTEEIKQEEKNADVNETKHQDIQQQRNCYQLLLSEMIC